MFWISYSWTISINFLKSYPLFVPHRKIVSTLFQKDFNASIVDSGVVEIASSTKVIQLNSPTSSSLCGRPLKVFTVSWIISIGTPIFNAMAIAKDMFCILCSQISSLSSVGNNSWLSWMKYPLARDVFPQIPYVSILSYWSNNPYSSTVFVAQNYIQLI